VGKSTYDVYSCVFVFNILPDTPEETFYYKWKRIVFDFRLRVNGIACNSRSYRKSRIGKTIARNKTTINVQCIFLKMKIYL